MPSAFYVCTAVLITTLFSAAQAMEEPSIYETRKLPMYIYYAMCAELPKIYKNYCVATKEEEYRATSKVDGVTIIAHGSTDGSNIYSCTHLHNGMLQKCDSPKLHFDKLKELRIRQELKLVKDQGVCAQLTKNCDRYTAIVAEDRKLIVTCFKGHAIPLYDYFFNPPLKEHPARDAKILCDILKRVYMLQQEEEQLFAQKPYVQVTRHGDGTQEYKAAFEPIAVGYLKNKAIVMHCVQKAYGIYCTHVAGQERVRCPMAAEHVGKLIELFTTQPQDTIKSSMHAQRKIKDNDYKSLTTISAQL
jgi:hypothetical protein